MASTSSGEEIICSILLTDETSIAAGLDPNSYPESEIYADLKIESIPQSTTGKNILSTLGVILKGPNIYSHVTLSLSDQMINHSSKIEDMQTMPIDYSSFVATDSRILTSETKYVFAESKLEDCKPSIFLGVNISDEGIKYIGFNKAENDPTTDEDLLLKIAQGKDSSSPLKRRKNRETLGDVYYGDKGILCSSVANNAARAWMKAVGKDNYKEELVPGRGENAKNQNIRYLVYDAKKGVMKNIRTIIQCVNYVEENFTERKFKEDMATVPEQFLICKSEQFKRGKTAE